MYRGWIKLWKKSLDSDVWLDARIWKTWTCCLMLAHRIAGWQTFPGLVKPVWVDAGQFVTGRFSFHEKMYPPEKMGRKKRPTPITTWRWLNLLAKRGLILLNVNNRYTLVTIVNWDTYQPLFKTFAKDDPIHMSNHSSNHDHNREGKKKRGGDGNGLQPLPPDFCLTERLRLWAEQKKLCHYDLEAEMEKFKAHYFGNGQLRSDWNWVWKKWMIGCNEKGGALKQNTNLDDECPLFEGNN